jgi:hypothetical protein
MPLHLLDGPETPQEHIRNALMALDELEREFLAMQLILPDDTAYKLYLPLATARGRLWRAISQLEGGKP